MNNITVKEKPLVFKARPIVGPDGKKNIAIDPIVEERRHISGRVDIIVHMPTLDLINQCKVANGIE